MAPESFWYEPEGQGASLPEIEATEAAIGHRLPDELRHLLLIQNGGVAAYASVASGRGVFPLLPFFGVGITTEVGTILGALSVAEVFGVPPNVVPFAGLGHSWWGLEYAQPGAGPRVVYRDHLDAGIEVVSETFGAMLAHLEVE